MRTLFLMLLAVPAFAGEPFPAASLPPSSAQTFAQLDSNRDGVLTFSEAFADPRISNNFNVLDKDANGVLSPAEYQAIFH
jgi:EF hand domain-containing protein